MPAIQTDCNASWETWPAKTVCSKMFRTQIFLQESLIAWTWGEHFEFTLNTPINLFLISNSLWFWVMMTIYIIQRFTVEKNYGIVVGLRSIWRETQTQFLGAEKHAGTVYVSVHSYPFLSIRFIFMYFERSATWENSYCFLLPLPIPKKQHSNVNINPQLFCLFILKVASLFYFVAQVTNWLGWRGSRLLDWKDRNGWWMNMSTSMLWEKPMWQKHLGYSHLLPREGWSQEWRAEVGTKHGHHRVCSELRCLVGVSQDLFHFHSVHVLLLSFSYFRNSLFISFY